MKTKAINIILSFLFICCFLLTSTTSLFSQTTRIEAEGSYGWVTAGFGNYTSTWGGSVTGVAGMSGSAGTGPGGGNDCSGTGNMRAVYTTLANLGLQDGTYDFTFGFYKNSGSSNVTNTVWTMFGPASKVASIPKPPASNTFMQRVESYTWTHAPSTRVPFSTPTYTAIKLTQTDAIFVTVCVNSSSDALLDYIDIKPTYPNNNNPTIPNSQVLSIAENNCTGAVIGNVSASDADMPLAIDQRLTYSITAGNTGNEFFIDPLTGQIRANATFDFETRASYTLTVRVTDNGTPSKFTTNTITVNINNIASEITNNPPSFANQSFPAITENSNFGTVVGTLTASDPDGHALSFRILSGDPNSVFRFQGKDLVVNGAVDYETKSSYTLLVEASDNSCPQRKTTANVTFNVTNVAVETPNGSCVSLTGQGNLVPNGDFESAINATYSDYTFSSNGCANGPGSFGWSVVSPTPCRSSYVHPTKGGIPADASGNPTGHYMNIDAEDDATPVYKSQAIAVTPGVRYYFSAWIANINKSYSNPSELAFYIDGVRISPSVSIQANATDYEWSQFFTTWDNTTGKTSVVLSFVNLNNSGSGNDMALDNVFFSGSCQGIDRYKTSQLPSSLEVCNGGSATLDSKVDPTSTFTWAKNGTSIPGSGPAIVTGSGSAAFGRYTVCYTKDGCSILDTVDVLLCTLPVELKSFHGWKNGKVNTLQWTTSSEKNNDYFVVERSGDGTEFVSLGIVQGNGNSSSALSYIFTDENPLEGKNYYRLRQVDFDGAFNYSDVTIVDQENEVDVLIYPNPNNGSFAIQVNHILEQSFQVMITDVEGKMVYASISTSHEKLELTDLAKGFYIVRISLEDKIVTQKMVIY